MRIVRILLKTLLYGCLATIAWMLTLDGVVNHYFADPHPSTVRLTSTSKTAVVFFTAAQSSGTAHSAPLKSLWDERGDVIIVEYNPNRFVGQQIAYDVYRQLVDWQYERAILIGASLGGLLATDVIDNDRAGTTHLQYAVMFQGVPLDSSDLYHQDSADAIARAWYPGPVTNYVGTDLMWRYVYNPPPPYMLGPDVDQKQLAAQHQVGRHYPLSGWAGEVRYIAHHRGFERNQYVGIPLVIMESEHDTVVKPTANRWRPVFGSATVIKVPEAGHVDFVEHPDAWRQAFQKGFASLKGW